MLLAALLVIISAPLETRGSSWRTFDVDANGRFDGADVARILADGPDTPSLDVNGDGAKNAADAWELTVLLTKWDRGADLAVSADDFAPLPRLEAQADAAAVLRLAQALVARDAPASPPRGAPRRGKAPAPRSDALAYEALGAAALVQHNLDVATWAYAKSVVLDAKRPSALSGLGFGLMSAGRLQDALTVLLTAHPLAPGACPLHANLGWVYARQGMLAEAEQAYGEAATSCPTIGQYALDLAVVKLAKGDRIGALRAARKAATEVPADPEAWRISIALDPPAAATTAELADLYEREQHLKDPSLPAWGELDDRAKIDAILDSLDSAAERECEDARREAGRRLLERYVAVEKAVRPEWKKWDEDWNRWATNHEGVIRHEWLLGQEAARELGARCAEIHRRAEVRKLSAGPVILALARSVAASDRRESERRAVPRLPGVKLPLEKLRAAAADAEKKTIAELYGNRMARARAALSTPAEPVEPIFEQGSKALGPGGVAMLGPTISLACIGVGAQNPSYADTKSCKALRGEPPGELEFSGSITLSLFDVVELEFDLRSKEIKLQVGQGVIVAGTWSPKAGFGFQVGVGFDVEVGPASLEVAEYLKFGSDGSVVLDFEASAGAGGENLSGDVSFTDSTALFPAGHEPIGAM